MNPNNLPAAEYLELEADLVYSQGDIDCVRLLVAAAVLAPADRAALNARLDTQANVFARGKLLAMLAGVQA